MILYGMGEEQRIILEQPTSLLSELEIVVGLVVAVVTLALTIYRIKKLKGD